MAGAATKEKGKQKCAYVVGDPEDEPVGDAISPGIFSDAQNAAVPCGDGCGNEGREGEGAAAQKIVGFVAGMWRLFLFEAQGDHEDEKA